MNRGESFFKTVCAIAIPVTLQTMLQSSFGIVDQIMIGQLGSSNVAGVGMAGKFTSIYSVVISAIGAVAGIMISQYLGKHDHEEVRRSFLINLFFGEEGRAPTLLDGCRVRMNQWLTRAQHAAGLVGAVS